MHKRIRTNVWLIIAAIIIGVACIPVSGLYWMGGGPPIPGLVGGDGPDLKSSIEYPQTVNIGSVFTITITVTNTGTQPSTEVPAWVFFPNDSPNPNPPSATIPSLQPGQSTTITISLTVPPNLSPGNTLFNLILDPWNENGETNLLNNDALGHTFVLPEGMTKEEYESQTRSPTYKITELFVDPPSGGGQAPA